MYNVQGHFIRYPSRVPATVSTLFGWYLFEVYLGIRITQLNEVPKRRRRGVPRMFRTAEWAQAVEKMNAGLAANEAIVITLTPNEMAHYRISSLKSAARPMRQHIKTHRLPYSVATKNTAEGGTIVISRAAKNTGAPRTPRRGRAPTPH